MSQNELTKCKRKRVWKLCKCVTNQSCKIWILTCNKTVNIKCRCAAPNARNYYVFLYLFNPHRILLLLIIIIIIFITGSTSITPCWCGCRYRFSMLARVGQFSPYTNGKIVYRSIGAKCYTGCASWHNLRQKKNRDRLCWWRPSL